MSTFGTIKDPFKSFNKKTKIGSVKQGCYGCDGCKYEFFGSAMYPCSICSHNMKTKNTGAKNHYEKKGS